MEDSDRICSPENSEDTTLELVTVQIWRQREEEPDSLGLEPGVKEMSELV